MSDTPLKVIRARKNKKAQKNNAGKGGDLDLKVSIYKAGVFNNKRKIVVTDNSGNAIQGKDPIEYSTNGRYSSYTELDFIKDYLDTLIKLEGGTSSVTTEPGYQIIQDPWESRVPIIRDFGNDSYYLNNGVIVDILWFYEKREVIGTYSFDGKVEKEYKTTYIPDGGVEWCDKKGFDISTRENSEIIRGTVSSSGGAFIDPNKITKFDISKTVKLTMPDGSIYGIGNIPENEQKLKTGYNYDRLAIVKYNDRKRINDKDYNDKDDDNWIKVEYYDSNITDWNLLNNIKDLYCLQLQRNKFVSSGFDYKLEICRNPDYDACHVNGGINFIDPITGAQNKDEPPKEEKKEEVPPPTTDNSKTNATGTKIKLNIVLPNGFKAIANMDMNPIDIFVGDVPVPDLGYRKESEDGEEILSEEYIEDPISGPSKSEADEHHWDPEKDKSDGEILKQIEKDRQEGKEPTLPDKTITKGKWEFDIIYDPKFPDGYVTNSGVKIKCVSIDGYPVNITIASAYLDMAAAAKKEGVYLTVISGFRSSYDAILTSAATGYNGTIRTTKSVSVASSSQKYLYDEYLAGRGNVAAKPGNSNHGSGIALDLNPGGKSKGRYIGVVEKTYEWLVKNSWRFGFVRAVASEEWHFDYKPEWAKEGPYGAVGKYGGIKTGIKDTGDVGTKFYNKKENGDYWGLDEIKIT